VSAPAIRAVGLSRHFGSFKAVDDVRFEVGRGEIFGYLGANGAGKSTTIRMLTGLLAPTGGEAWVAGHDVGRDPESVKAAIGYMSQKFSLYLDLPVLENLLFFGGAYGLSGRALRSRAEELLAVVGLDPARYARRYPAQLSGGERQRVGVARALAADPPIMLMDEPFGAVDPIVRERLQNEFLRLQEQLAKTILFVTHDIDEAIKMGDLVAVFRNGGVVEQFGPPAEILAAPASEFVARFVGVDRGLKRLSLARVADLDLAPAVTARIGDECGDVRRRAAGGELGYVLLLDDQDRPFGWADAHRIPASGPIGAELATATSPLLDRRTTLKDALSMLLDEDVQAGVVVDRRGAFRGLVTAQQVMAFMRDTAREATDAQDGRDAGDGDAALPMRERVLEVARSQSGEDAGRPEAG